MDCRCPSGLCGHVRGLKVSEERILADRPLLQSGAAFDKLLEACWERTEDPGPYAFEGAPDWSKVLVGDRFYALLSIRAATYGPEYAFRVACESCRHRIEWTLSLLDLDVKRLRGESVERFRDGNRFHTVLPDARRTVAFKLLTGADERRLAQLSKHAKSRPLSAMLAYRVADVDGVPDTERRQFLEGLSMRDAAHLLEAFEDADCGVQTKIDIECPQCLAVQEVELPFGADFFLPRARTT